MKRGVPFMAMPVLLLFCANGPLAEQPNRSLIFDFPDGVRGGHGKIKGERKRPAHPSIGATIIPGDIYLNTIRECGGKNVRIPESQWTHHFYILADSTSKDRSVVACFRKRIWGNFSVFVGSSDLSKGERDDRPFRHFWIKPPESK